MSTSFRTKHIVIRRAPGYWIDGFYYPEPSGFQDDVMMSIQNPSTGDRNAIEALPMGDRVSRYIKIYTDTRLQPVSQQPNGAPGDIVIHDEKRYLIIGESLFQGLKKTQTQTPVSHYRYYATEIIEGEKTATPHALVIDQ